MGGPGEYRGGLSYRREYEVACPVLGELPSGSQQISEYRSGRRQTWAPWTYGPESRQRSGERGAGDRAVRYSSGGRFCVEGAGAGGYGDPLARPAKVLQDVRRGYLSPSLAKDDYGVVIDERSMTIDEAATEEVRSRISG